MFQLPVRVWGDFLRADWLRTGDLRQRYGPHDYRLHRRAIPRYLSSLPVTHGQQAQSCCQAHHSHLDTLAVPRRPSGIYLLALITATELYTEDSC